MVGYSPTVYFKRQVTKQRAENNKLIKEEKRYQNAIAKIRKKATDMSYAEEKEEREKQRQEYQEELQEAYEDYQDKINDVKVKILRFQAVLRILAMSI